MLLDILNSIIYLLVAHFISLGCLAVFGINLKKLPDEQSVLDWVNAYREKYYIPFSGWMRNTVFNIKVGYGVLLTFLPTKAAWVLPGSAFIAWYITPVDMEITNAILLINLVYNAALGLGVLIAPKYKVTHC